MMNRNIVQRVLMIMAFFYIGVSLLAVGMLGVTGSFFSKRISWGGQNPFSSAASADEDKDGEEVIPERIRVSEVEETFDHDMEVTEEAAEEASAEVTEEAPEAAEAVDSTEETGFYSFISNNDKGRLNMRKEPTIRAKVVYAMPGGTRGYILDMGEEWSHVSVSGNEGYCANEYLSMMQVSREDFPEDLRDRVGQAPIEDAEDPEDEDDALLQVQ